MRLYIIKNQFETIFYVLANNIEEAILKFRKINDSEIVNIQFVTKKIIIGEENE